MSNRDAVGSLVTVYTGEKKQIRYRRCESGYLEQDNPWMHFGIGFETSVDSVVIRWSLGYRQVLTNIAINHYHEIKEPDYTSVESRELLSTKPASFVLEQNYPNPFNPSTRIHYTLIQSTDIQLAVYDITGKEITTLLVNQKQEAGSHSIDWNGRDREGNVVSSGVYLYQLKVGNLYKSKKMVFIQ